MLNIGIVIIGRNEGERLKRCVHSVIRDHVVVVYVDSGSDDDSMNFCEQQGVNVIELDTSIPFSAARARNEGIRWLIQHSPNLSYIQFIDGDCELIEGWLDHATQQLQAKENLAIVCGRRKERCPEQSIYNQLCDIEWNTTIGQTGSCGGDFMGRTDALTEVGGFNPAVIAGEEPDLCYRLRLKGWEIERTDVDMTWHDAMIFRFSQWWRRTLRSGHAYAHNMVLHWGGAEKVNIRIMASIFVWGLALPAICLLSLIMLKPSVALVILLLYVLMLLKISYSIFSNKHYPLKVSMAYGFFTMLGKIPQAIGALKYFIKWFSSDSFKIIEYK